MRSCVLFLALAVLLAIPCLCQTAGTAKVSTECKNRALKQKPLVPPEFKFLPGESYKGPPSVRFQIGEDGSVSGVRLAQSSGVKGIDKWVLKEVSKWKYGAVPGCVIETEMMLVIDWK